MGIKRVWQGGRVPAAKFAITGEFSLPARSFVLSTLVRAKAGRRVKGGIPAFASLPRAEDFEARVYKQPGSVTLAAKSEAVGGIAVSLLLCLCPYKQTAADSLRCNLGSRSPLHHPFAERTSLTVVGFPSPNYSLNPNPGTREKADRQKIENKIGHDIAGKMSNLIFY